MARPGGRTRGGCSRPWWPIFKIAVTIIESAFATFWEGTEMAWPHRVNDEGTFLKLIVKRCRMQEPLITHFTTARISCNTLFGCMYDFSSKLMQPHATLYPGRDKILGTRLKLMSHIVLHILVPRPPTICRRENCLVPTLADVWHRGRKN